MNPAQWFTQQWQPQPWFLGRLEDLHDHGCPLWCGSTISPPAEWEQSWRPAVNPPFWGQTCKEDISCTPGIWFILSQIRLLTRSQTVSLGTEHLLRTKRTLGIFESCTVHIQHFSALLSLGKQIIIVLRNSDSQQPWGMSWPPSLTPTDFSTLIQRKLQPVPKMGKSWQWRMGWWVCNIKGGRQESRVWADGGECRKKKEKQEIGIWVIWVTRCECCRRAGGAAVGWGQCGSHLVLPNPSMAEFLMAQPLVWYAHFWRRGYGHSSESPLGQMCVEPPLALDFPHTQWKSITTQKKQRASQQGWLWKLHTQLARPGTQPHPCWQISPQSSHIHLSAPSSYCTFSPSQINIPTSSPSLPLHTKPLLQAHQTSQCLSSLSTSAHGLSSKNSKPDKKSLSYLSRLIEILLFMGNFSL